MLHYQAKASLFLFPVTNDYNCMVYIEVFVQFLVTLLALEDTPDILRLIQDDARPHHIPSAFALYKKYFRLMESLLSTN